ncbi:MAG: hypothetical protein CL610_23165 [Anaerolineaceae bacterium]|nr:hypothetical protein [Anaerolineaceae bacterium]
MTKKPKKSTMADSPTGIIPRPHFDEYVQNLKEPPQPLASQPELDTDESITGFITVEAEGEDAAKHADDGPTKSATQG